MDLVRLAIVYDTAQAATALQSLDGQLATVQTRTAAVNTTTARSTQVLNQHAFTMRGASRAAIVLAQGLSTGQLSAASMTRSVEMLGGAVGVVGVALGVAVGLFVVWRRYSDAAREATLKLQKQLRDTKRAVDDLLRVGPKNEFQNEIQQITDAIADLNREIDKGKGNLLQRLFGGLTLPNIKRFFLGGEDPELIKQRRELELQRGRLTPQAREAQIFAESQRQSNAAVFLGRLTGASSLDVAAQQIQTMEDALKKLIDEGLDPASIEAVQTGKQIQEYAAQLRQAERAAKLMQSGLETISSAIEDFVVKGTFAFTEFLDNILRLLYQDFSSSIIDAILRSQFGVGGASAPSTPTVTPVPGPGPINQSRMAPQPSMSTQVNYTVQAVDAQSVASFFERNGGLMAAELARAASRSRALRRRLLRG